MAESAKSIPLVETRLKEKPVRRPIRWGNILSYLLLALGVIVAMLPFVWLVSASLMTQAEVSLGRIVPSEPQFDNYGEAWDRASFGHFMWNSTRITAITVVGLLLFCIPAAYAFARMKFFGRNALFAIMLTTLMIPDIVTLIPNFLTVIWLGRFSQAVCGEVCGWYNNWPALTVPFMASAFSIFLLRQFFAQLPDELWDAARIDGAGHLRFLVQIVLPLSKAPVMTVITFAFIGSWNSLLWPLLVTQDDTWRPVATGLSKFVNSDAPGDYHLYMAASVITIVPILMMYFITQKQFTEGIATSGLKG